MEENVEKNHSCNIQNKDGTNIWDRKQQKKSKI